jgi:hypothetical protein
VVLVMGEYQRQIDRAQEALEQVAQLRGVDIPGQEPTEVPTEGGTEPAPTETVTPIDG